MAATAALDTTFAVKTPENIAFEYQLAGPFRRLPAYLIDVSVRWGVIIALGIGLMLVMGLIDILSLTPFAIAAGFILYFVISWFYGTILETYFNGRTVGKWACGIRTIDVDGRPVSGKQALIRNLLRIADLAPVAAASQIAEDVPPAFLIPTGMIGLLSMIATRRLQRLGDLAAGTMVIVDERSWRLPVAKVDDPRVPALASFVPGDYRVSRSMARTLAVYAERRHFLTPARRREVARHLTVPLVDRFEFRRDIDPDLLLYALYYKTFLADSSAELPDLGPLAGYSPLLRDANKPQGLARQLTGQAAGTSSAAAAPVNMSDASVMNRNETDANAVQPVEDVSPIVASRPAPPATADSAPAGATGINETTSQPQPPPVEPTWESQQDPDVGTPPRREDRGL